MTIARLYEELPVRLPSSGCFDVGSRASFLWLSDSGFNGVRSNWSGAAFSDADSVQCYDVGGAAALYFPV